MDTSHLTVKVTNISMNATREDVIRFFAYCGTVDDVHLHKDGDQTQFALVSFKQPYAFKTALLLNDAILVDRRICITQTAKSTKSDQNANGGSVPPSYPVLHTIASKGQEMLSKAKEMDEKFKVSQTGKAAATQSKMAITKAEQAAGHLGSAIISSTCFSKSALWVSDVLDKASRWSAELGNYKYRNTNSRKQK